jgi:hypothetical protein
MANLIAIAPLPVFMGTLAIIGGLRKVRVRYTRNGGMRFLRVHRLQMSWCVCRNPLP